jgi:hypothetical protein
MSVSYHNSVWGKIITPLRSQVWERSLVSHPDRSVVNYICSGGFRVGFDYRGAKCVSAKGNTRSVAEHREVVDAYVQGENRAGRLLGPFDRSKYPGVQVSSFGVIPKSDPGEWRLIVDLSSPVDWSVNDGIDSRVCSLSYVKVDEIVGMVRSYGRGALLAKFDIKAAYRNVPIHLDDRWLLGLVWDDMLYMDAVLPFGLRSAPKIFTAVADALAWIY